jgi:hypothetical protein
MRVFLDEMSENPANSAARILFSLNPNRENRILWVQKTHFFNSFSGLFFFFSEKGFLK